MLIDWFTVIAQGLNFIILVWLMKHLLYKPILNAIDQREQRIAKELADADAKKVEAQKEREEFQNKNDEFDQQRSVLLSKATDEAQAEREKLLDGARTAAEVLSAKLENNLKSEENKLFQAISRRTEQEVFAITRKVLRDLATTSLEECLGAVFIRRLRELSAQAKSDFAAALKRASGPALVLSAFDLPQEQRADIQKAINEAFSADIQLRFETTPSLIGGIELSTIGQKVAWSISDYLNSLEKSVEKILAEKQNPEAKTESKHEELKSEGVQQ